MIFESTTTTSQQVFYEYVEKAKEANEEAQKTSYNGRSQVFDYDLKLGESLEQYIIDKVNNDLPTSYTAEKIEFESDDYFKYNHVDILIKKNGVPHFCIDAKCLMCYMKKSQEFFGIPPENNIAINYHAILEYKKNDIPTFLLVYNDTTHPDNKAGFYVRNVKSIDLDNKYIWQQKGKYGKSSYKYNLDNQTFKYYSSLDDLFKVK